MVQRDSLVRAEMSLGLLLLFHHMMDHSGSLGLTDKAAAALREVLGPKLEAVMTSQAALAELCNTDAMGRRLARMLAGAGVAAVVKTHAVRSAEALLPVDPVIHAADMHQVASTRSRVAAFCLEVSADRPEDVVRLLPVLRSLGTDPVACFLRGLGLLQRGGAQQIEAAGELGRCAKPLMQLEGVAGQVEALLSSSPLAKEAEDAQHALKDSQTRAIAGFLGRLVALAERLGKTEAMAVLLRYLVGYLGGQEGSLAALGYFGAQLVTCLQKQGRFEEAYAALTAVPQPARAWALLPPLVAALCDRGRIDLLCSLPWTGSPGPEGQCWAEGVHAALLDRAERSDVGTRPQPFLVAFDFSMSREDARSAAGAAARYLRRLEAGQGPAASVLAALEILHESLSLVRPARFQWVEDGQGAMVTLPEVERQLAVARARVDALGPRERVESGQGTGEVLQRLSRERQFRRAAELAVAVLPDGPERLQRLVQVVREAARHSAQLQGQEQPSVSSASASTSGAAGAWQELRALLSDMDGPATGYQLRAAVLDQLLLERRGAAVPQWLVDSFLGPSSSRPRLGGMGGGEGSDPAALIRALMRHGQLKEAAQIALDMLQWSQLTDAVTKQRTGAAYFPYGLLDELAARLDKEGLVDQLDALQECVAEHLADCSHATAVRLGQPSPKMPASVLKSAFKTRF